MMVAIDLAPASPTTAQEGRRAQMRAMIVDTARAAFFARGYGATSMSSIAAAVGGSKTTLWSHFGRKEELFAGVVDELVERFGQSLATSLDTTQPVEEALIRYGNAMLTITTQPEILELQRLVIGEAGRFPELGRMFFERGPARGKARLADYLAVATADGRLCAGDPLHRAAQFAFMCQSRIHQQRLMGLVDTVPAEDIAADVAAATATAVRAWAP